MKTRLLSLVCIGAPAILGGCATYHAKPIDQAAVDQALQAPPIDSVKVAAAQIQHPLVKPVVIDGRDGFSPDEIAVMVVIVSPDLRALRAQQGVAQAQVMQAGILPNPQLSYSIDRPHGNEDPTLVDARNLGLSWEITSLLSHHSQVAAAKAAAGSLNLSVAWQEWQAAQEARMRAFRILSLEKRLPLARSVENAELETLNLTRKALQMGHRTAIDLTTEIAAWTTAQNVRFDLENQLTAERAALNLSLGMSAGQSVQIKPASAFPAMLLDPSTAATSFLQGLEDRRLDLVALKLGYESQEANLRTAVIQQFPKINLNINKARDTTPVYTRGGGLTVDIPIFDRNQGQIAIAKATREQLFAEYVARVAQARSDVGKIVEALSIVRSQLEEAKASLPELQDLNKSMDKAYAARNIDYQAYRDAQAALAARQIEESQLQQQELELGVALEIATGRPLLNRGL